MTMRVVDSILSLIGSTPVVRLRNIVPEGSAAVWVKLEGLNPAGSLKDRICLGMISRAEEDGLIAPGRSVIVEPTGGNTGIGLALVCAVRGYRLILTAPDDITLERSQMLSAYGAEVVLTPASEGIEGVLRAAEEIAAGLEDSFMPNHFINPENPEAHRLGTGPEIIEQVSGTVDAFVAAVGTGGTIAGAGGALRKEYPDILLAAVEMEESPGTSAGFIVSIPDRSSYDEVIGVSEAEAKRLTRELARREGILAGVSSGAACAGALLLAERLGGGKQVVTVFCDTGERYLSTGLFG